MRLSVHTIAAQTPTFAAMMLAIFGPVTADRCTHHDIERWHPTEGWDQSYQAYFTPSDTTKWREDGLPFWWQSQEFINMKICNRGDPTPVYEGLIRPPCCLNRVSRAEPSSGLTFVPDEGYYVVRGECDCFSTGRLAMADFLESDNWEGMFENADYVPSFIEQFGYSYHYRNNNQNYMRSQIEDVTNMNRMFKGADMGSCWYYSRTGYRCHGWANLAYWRIDTRTTSTENMFQGATNMELSRCPCLVPSLVHECPGLPELGTSPCITQPPDETPGSLVTVVGGN